MFINTVDTINPDPHILTSNLTIQITFLQNIDFGVSVIIGQ